VTAAVRALVAAWTLALLAACGVIGPSGEEVEDAVVAVMPALAEWRADSLTLLATAEFNRALAEPEQARRLAAFSKLGGLVSFLPPSTVGWSASTGGGMQTVAEVSATFERGPAAVRLTLRREDGALKLHGLDIRSPVLGDPSAAPRAPQQI
jgi:hypothetical protein